MAFGYFSDAKSPYCDTTHFPPVFEKYPFKGPGLYRVEGKVVVEFGFPSVEVVRLDKLAFRPDPRDGDEPSQNNLYLN